MRENKIMTIAKEQKDRLQIELIALRKKFIPKSFITYIYYRKDNYSELYDIILKSHDKEEFYKLIDKYLSEIKEDKQEFIPKGIATMKFLGNYLPDNNFILKQVVKRIYSNDYSSSEIKQILNTYETQLVNFINNNKRIKNKINNLDNYGERRAATADLTKPFTKEEYRKIYEYIGIPIEQYPHYKDNAPEFNQIINNVMVINELLIMLLALYDKNTLTNDKEFVEFELNYGYTEKYYEQLTSNQSIPSIEVRKQVFLQERNITEREQYYLTQLDLLEERILTLTTPTKELILQKIALIREEKDLSKKAKLITEVHEYYEKEFRKQIVESLYSPTESHEVSDIDELRPLLLHLFIRDPYKMAASEEQKILEEIGSRRGIKVTKVEELTKEEQEEYQRRVTELREVLLNPVVTNRSLNTSSYYSDANGWRWYKSDTSNQISASLVSIEVLLRMGNCIGVGFDSNSIDARNIIISSNQYQTTNMGVDNLEISREDEFREKSAPLQELTQSYKTEVVMYRSKDGIDTKAAYVFACISGTDFKRDEETILKAKAFAEQNHIKLIVFNRLKLQQSYDEKLSQNKKS